MEERFFTNDSGSFSFRLRNQFTTELNIVNKIDWKLRIPISLEAFYEFDNISSDFFERSRLRFFTGLDYHHKDKWRIEALYNFQGNQKGATDTNQTDVMYRLRFYIYLRKSSHFKK